MRLETEIERRVMEGTEEVRREAEDGVRKMVEKVEREAEDLARNRAEEQMKAESDRIRIQGQRREERAREATENEIKASVSKARREAQAAAEQSAPAWLQAGVGLFDGRLPDLLTSASPCARCKVRDTLSGELRTVDPDQEVGIYACGPTVYSRIHIGNARPFVVFSLLARFLRSEGYRTRLVVNVTDVNDKIYTAASSAEEHSDEFAKRMTAPISKTPRDSASVGPTPSRWRPRGLTGSSN